MLALDASLSSPPRGRSGGSAAVLVCLFLLLLPVLYFLSVGPAILLVNQGVVNEDVLNMVYFPLILAYDLMPSLQAPMDWYLSLWGG